jgi:hypothetical protein
MRSPLSRHSLLDAAPLPNVEQLPGRHPLTLSDAQLKTLMTLAAREAIRIIERVGAMLMLKGRLNDADLAEVAKRASVGLARSSAA